jgi:hypothetical protein
VRRSEPRGNYTFLVLATAARMLVRSKRNTFHSHRKFRLEKSNLPEAQKPRCHCTSVLTKELANASPILSLTFIALIAKTIFLSPSSRKYIQ